MSLGWKDSNKKKKVSGCRWVVIGKNIRRLRCCIKTMTCHGNKCGVAKKKKM